MADTGEPTASIHAREDDVAWHALLPRLQGGMHLYRPIRLDRYYLRAPGGDVLGGGSLSAVRVKRLTREHVLEECGPGEFKLTGDWLNGR